MPDIIHVNSSSTDLARVRHILAKDPVWATYALADLQPALAVDSRWWTATGDNGDALVLVYSGLEPPILFTMGEPQALAAVLAQADLPPAVSVSVREEHLPAVLQHYSLSTDLRPMQRMVLTDPQAAQQSGRPIAWGGLSPVTPTLACLGGANVADVVRLLAIGGAFTPDGFSPAQMDAGVFYGFYAGTELLAVGGTHVVDFNQGVAAIGNMYTHPEHRRRGYCAAILRAIVRELLDHAVTTIVLNVDQRNPGAQALYLAHGFIVHVPFFEGKGNRTVVRVLKEKQTL